MWKPTQIQQTDPRHKSPAHDPGNSVRRSERATPLKFDAS